MTESRLERRLRQLAATGEIVEINIVPSKKEFLASCYMADGKVRMSCKPNPAEALLKVLGDGTPDP